MSRKATLRNEEEEVVAGLLWVCTRAVNDLSSTATTPSTRYGPISGNGGELDGRGRGYVRDTGHSPVALWNEHKVLRKAKQTVGWS